MKYYIKERHNKFGVCYIACGKLTESEANENEKYLGCSNYMFSYDTKEEYEKALFELNFINERI